MRVPLALACIACIARTAAATKLRPSEVQPPVAASAEPVTPVATLQANASEPSKSVVHESMSQLMGAIFGPKVAAMNQHEWWVVVRTCSAWSILLAGVWLWTWYLPRLYMSHKESYLKEDIEGRTFEQYLTYHFNYWLSLDTIKSMLTLLGIGVLTLMTGGGFAYALFMGVTPVKGLWLFVLWSSMASIDPAVTAMEGGVGMLETIGGMVLLAVLLTAISDFFAEKQRTAAQGRDPVVEGGHIVLLGLSSQTKEFLEEIAVCEANGAPKTVAILDPMPKLEIEETIRKQNTSTGDLKIICRSGIPANAKDLWKVGADVCSRITILDEPLLPRDEADASTFGKLLTLRGQGEAGWPINGHVSVQCCLAKNVSAMSKLYPGKTFVMSGERLGRLMVSSVVDQGLCPVFNEMVGFDGNEFYVGDASALGLVGKTFREVPFWCEYTVPIGIRDAQGVCKINPEKSYVVKEDDAVIVLADDDDALQKMDEPLFDFSRWLSDFGEGQFQEGDCNDNELCKALICSFTERGYGTAILFALDEMSAPGSECDIFCTISEEEVHAIVENAEEEAGKKLRNISVKNIFSVDEDKMTAQHKIAQMPLHTYDYTFVLANAGLGFQKADEQTVGMILQMKAVLEKEKCGREFNPLVEICTLTAQSQLELCGITNTINTTHMMSKALALVCIDTIAHGVFSDLLSADGNNLDIMFLQDYIKDEREKLPEKISFAECMAIVNRSGVQHCLIGWSEGLGRERAWLINPTDKLQVRPWCCEDKIIVIKDV
eukprot:TRINITY_DN9211_c0_g2_i1.p1 TRINITY_DN9211_c0_g2~~TRINITY_DN9211_c0_g2_i1.p1  ORF type:complete len:773 (-),score=183.45 TRINITY_DN9211_c0_g2_i1:100-2418(-)